jgi:transketolase
MIIQNRIKEISIKHGLSHCGSNLTCADIINDIYYLKKEDETFVLSCGHSSLALYCVLEQYYGLSAEKLYLKHGTHPNRDLNDKIEVSTGSLGMGLGIALGMALADRTKNVYCLISDGESFEGIIWEVANVMYKYNVTNLKVYCNYNGLSAYDEIHSGHEERLSQLFDWNIKIVRTNVQDYGFKGLEAHYNKL